MCHHHEFSDSQDEVSFLESSLFDSLVEGFESLSLVAIEFVGVYHSKLLAPEVKVDASPHLSSPWSRQHVEMKFEFLVGVRLHTHTPKRMV